MIMVGQLKNILRQIFLKLATKSNYKFILKDWAALKDLNALSNTLASTRFSKNLYPITVLQPEIERILIIAPHPDDDVLSSGGTMLKIIRNEGKVKTITLTSGCYQTYSDTDQKVLTGHAAKIEEETQKVSNELGTDMEFWRYPNKGISIDDELKKRLKKVYQDMNPDALFLPFIADDNDDHRRTAQLFYETFKHFKDLDCEIWAYQVYSTVIPNVVVDITEVIDEKVRLINIWDTQKKQRDWGHYTKGLNAFNCRFLNTNQAHYAEAFFVVPAKEYIELCKIYFEHPAKDIYYCKEYQQ